MLHRSSATNPVFDFKSSLHSLVHYAVRLLQVLRQKVHKSFKNVKVVSNRMVFDDNGHLISFKGIVFTLVARWNLFELCSRNCTLAFQISVLWSLCIWCIEVLGLTDNIGSCYKECCTTSFDVISYKHFSSYNFEVLLQKLWLELFWLKKLCYREANS